jgi:hypothetical protein
MLTALLLFAVASHALSPVCVNSTCILGGVVDALLELVQRPEQTLVVSGVRCSDTVPNCKLQLVARTIEFVDANVTVGTLEANATTVEAKSGVVRSNQVLSISASGNVTVHGAVFTGGNILIAADSVTLSGGARISASGAGAIKPNPDADTALGASGQIYGAGGGHSSGYGIKPISYAIVAPMNVPFPPVVADDYRKPVVGGLVGGAATPDASIANLTSPTGPMAGGAPGGSVRLLLTGALTVGKDSSVEANGLEPQVTTTLACATGAYRVGCDVRKPEVSLVGGGGGGGGSVWIDALSILGDGQITANGGSVIKIRIPIAGALTEVASPGGAGGGGRVALYYRDQVAPTIVVRATGGRSQEFTAYGTAGFVYLKNMRTFAEELVLDNDYNQQRNPWPPTTLPAGAFAALTLRGAVIARAPTALNVALLTMSAKAQLRAASPFGDLVIRSDEVKLSDGARVAAGVVDISAQRINITGMTTEVTAAGTASGSPADGASTGTGGGGGGGPQAPGGGCMSVAGGAQSMNGKGGRGGSVRANLGGNGGGIVRLNAWNQLTFAMSPTLAVSGYPATSSGVAGAGGGGAGTIEIIADKIAGAARFLADGGSTKGTGGGGSGGFVVLKSANLTTLPPSITVVVNGGANEELMECKGNDGQISHDSMAVANRMRPFCRAGATFGDGGCVPCPLGSSTEGEVDASTCNLCKPGKHAPVKGMPNCLECEPGSASAGAGQARCLPCETGTFASEAGAAKCSVCGNDRQANATGKTSCDRCPEGTFTPCSAFDCPTTFCRWRPDFMDCGTVTCAECAKGDLRADCARWNKFSARKSILTGAALSCRCAVAKEKVEITLQARSGLGDVWTGGAVNATLTFGGGALAPISPIVRENGLFVFSFDFAAEGNYTITVTANGIDVGESPVTILVAPAVTVIANVTTTLENGVPDWGIGVAVGAVVLFLGALDVFCLCKRRRAQQAPAEKSAAAEMKQHPQSNSNYAAINVVPDEYSQGRLSSNVALQSSYDVVPAQNYDVVPVPSNMQYDNGQLIVDGAGAVYDVGQLN